MQNLLASEEPLAPLDNSKVYKFASLLVILTYVIAIYLYMQASKSLDKEIIVMARYTFSIESMVLKILLYCHQIMFLIHTASMVVMDGIVVILMYVCAARLKILENKLKNAMKYENLTELIREHQDILE